jgi:RNA polymerase sigma-70 factor (ECF subfamily)
MEANNRQTKLDERELIRLVEAAQDGRREAFEVLFAHYGRAVYAAGYARLGNEAEAQELCQEVFMRAIRKIGQLEDPLCFGGWLRSIANRMAINRAVRRRAMVSLQTDRVEAGCVEHETPLGRMLARERRDQVRRGLTRLSELDRQTLEAFYFRGRSLVQMSDEFESPVGTIKRRLHVARKRLAKELAALAPA